MAQLQNPLQFDCQNPYPLLPEDSYTYGDAKNHSRAVDEWLGLDLIEPQPSDSHMVVVEAQTWSHLSSQQFQTPYCEIRNILDHLRLQPKQTLVDLGCGYGRFAFVLNRHYPGVIFKGYEVDSHRVQRAKEKFQFYQLQNAEINLEDIAEPSFEIPKALHSRASPLVISSQRTAAQIALLHLQIMKSLFKWWYECHLEKHTRSRSN